VPDNKTVTHRYPEFGEFRDMPEEFATDFMVGLIKGACQLSIKLFLDRPHERMAIDAAKFNQRLEAKRTCTAKPV
jgi:predicted thioesterase